jgi:hypothetical protein
MTLLQKIATLYITLLFIGCIDKEPKVIQTSLVATKIIILPDTLKHREAWIEHDTYLLKKKLCQRLSLYDLESSTDSVEIRFWTEPALFSPSQLYILKGFNSDWTIFHYTLYERHFNPDKDDYKTWDGYKNPKFDSIIVESLRPLKMTWTKYIAQLNIDSLWTFPSQSELAGSFGANDGVSYTLELADKTRYRLIHYSNPNFHVDKDINFKKFIDFQYNLIGPVSFDKTPTR